MNPRYSHARRRLGGLATAIVLVAGTGVVSASPAAAAPAPRVDLRVLVVSDGGPEVAAIAGELATEGVPYTEVDLSDPGRPLITDAFLSDVASTGPRAKFESVVLPNEAPGGLAADELAALARLEQTFGIGQVDAYTWPHPAVGLNYAQDPGYVGVLDGMAATVSADGLNGAFGYLNGPVPIDDYDPGVSEVYGYLAVPLPDDPAAGTSFQTLVSVPIPGASAAGSLVGAYSHDGRRELVVTGAYNGGQAWFRVLAHGLVTWMTRGVHLGYDRNYFSVHVDDVFLPDSRWSVEGRCTPGDDCPPGSPYQTTDIRMTDADVDTLVDWQLDYGFKVSLAFNGSGSDAAGTADPLTAELKKYKDKFLWVSHTFSHEFLGCIQDFTVVPWRCATDPGTGAVQWLPQAEIAAQISQNVTWAGKKGFAIDKSELVTGEHSGLRVTPQQPVDNPNLAPALQQAGVRSLASDASREPAQRQVGPALTVPRHPMNVFYNVATAAEEVAEYNWIYNSVADGGSGLCEQHPDTTTCISPLDPATGYSGYIVPLEVRIALSHVLANDPRPHYLHQSNFAEAGIAYPVLSGVLSAYRSVFADNAPVVSLRLRDAATALQQSAAWSAAADGVVAYVLNNAVWVSAPSGSATVPITAPAGTGFGKAYGGEVSGYRAVTATPWKLSLPPGTY